MRQVPPTPRRGRLVSRDRAAPLRTCVGCRVRTAKSELLRLVAVEGVVVPDPRGRLPGRGAHLHPDPGCLELAERRRAFPRAFRLAGPLDTSVLRARLATRDARQQDGQR
ncbi:YlxR family protein [Actinomadura rubrobrunea]|uniref:YlxR family protein n=1 Tax=Actinomadura rubrobrunea TaxID=115335 RepID=UPI0009FC9B19|nr:YlxR family protein [Actinomadura rubrobrunea]